MRSRRTYHAFIERLRLEQLRKLHRALRIERLNHRKLREKFSGLAEQLHHHECFETTINRDSVAIEIASILEKNP